MEIYLKGRTRREEEGARESKKGRLGRGRERNFQSRQKESLKLDFVVENNRVFNS